MRIVVNNLNGSVHPQSFVTKGKQRLKQHIDTVYMNNGDEFEVELYNPTQNKVLAKIEMNGNSIGNGIILRPGERVFLERYIDEAKKFLFETYVVNGNNEEVKQAIVNNGDVIVKFYNEATITTYSVGSGNTSITINPNMDWAVTNTGTPYYGNAFTTTSMNTNAFFNASLTSGTISTSTNYSNKNLNMVEQPNSVKKELTSQIRHLETGRVEKGSDSNQIFEFDNTKFNTYPSWNNWWKIKPMSTKAVVKEDLTVYCTGCGSKRKKDLHKFCPHCGTKY